MEEKSKRKIEFKGISYDTGTIYLKNINTRDFWGLDIVHQDMRIIKNELNCNSVAIFGSDPHRLIECLEIALKYDLHVMIQPRIIDIDIEKTKEILIDLAKKLEYYRDNTNQKIIFNIGCEFTLFSQGITTGNNFKKRIVSLTTLWWMFPVYMKRLNLRLQMYMKEIRINFKGLVTYSAGSWEEVDWSIFDFIGINYYKDRWNKNSYEKRLQKFFLHNKPVIITEFGCCTFKGADRKGGAGFFIINRNKNPHQIKRKHLRSEKTQSDYIKDLFTLYRKNGACGAFVFTYMEPENYYSRNSKYDLDMASYGIIRAYSKQADGTFDLSIIYKEAFSMISALYKED